jgi:hypothetical protein
MSLDLPERFQVIGLSEPSHLSSSYIDLMREAAGQPDKKLAASAQEVAFDLTTLGHVLTLLGAGAALGGLVICGAERSRVFRNWTAHRHLC